MSDRRDWFEAPGHAHAQDESERGLRFECTMCGNCCTGPEGYVRFTPGEGRAIARELGITEAEFLERYTHDTPAGRSLRERETEHGHDCVFLDRETIPGKAVCGVYSARPAQCRTWPFWPEMLRSARTWRLGQRTCPGLNRGELIPPERIRVIRDSVPEDDSGLGLGR